MCTVQTGKNWDRPVSRRDVAMLKYRHTCLEQSRPGLIDDIYVAITDNACPKVAVLVALVALAHRVDHGKWSHGIQGVALMPFSAMGFVTSERYQAEGMVPFHDALLAFCLGMRNVALLQKALACHGMRFISYHDCGCGISRDDAGFERNPLYLALNHWRSWGEGVGTKVRRTDFNDIRTLATDMCEAEISSYEKMWAELQVIPPATLDMPHDVQESLKRVMKATTPPLQQAA